MRAWGLAAGRALAQKFCFNKAMRRQPPICMTEATYIAGIWPNRLTTEGPKHAATISDTPIRMKKKPTCGGGRYGGGHSSLGAALHHIADRGSASLVAEAIPKEAEVLHIVGRDTLVRAEAAAAERGGLELREGKLA